MATALCAILTMPCTNDSRPRGRKQPFARGRIARDPGARVEAGQCRHGEGDRRCDAAAARGPSSQRQWGDSG